MKILSLFLILLTFLFISCVFSSEKADLKIFKIPGHLQELSDKLIAGIIKQGPSEIRAMSVEGPFEYFEGDIDAETNEKTPKSYFQLEKDGYYPYEKVSVVLKNKSKFVNNLVSNCEPGFSRKKFPIEKSHFSKITMISENRAEVLLKTLCDVSHVHLVFIKTKGRWSLAGYFYEAARVDY